MAADQIAHELGRLPEKREYAERSIEQAQDSLRFFDEDRFEALPAHRRPLALGDRPVRENPNLRMYREKIETDLRVAEDLLKFATDDYAHARKLINDIRSKASAEDHYAFVPSAEVV